MSVELENGIYITDKAKEKVIQLMQEAGVAGNSRMVSAGGSGRRRVLGFKL